MRNDKKIKALRTKFKHEGYSIYNMMLEALDDCEYFKHEWDELNIELLAGDFEIESDMLVNIINYCIKLKLFAIEGGYIYSIGHIKRFERVLSKRKPRTNDVTGNLIAGNQEPDELPAIKLPVIPQRKVKEIKEDKSKGNSSDVQGLTTNPKIKKNGSVGSNAGALTHLPPKDGREKKKNRLDNPATVEEVLDYFSEKMIGKWAPARIETEANKFFNHYSANGWVQGKNKPIVNWKYAVNNWIMNEINAVYTNGHQGKAPLGAVTGVSASSQPKPEEKKLSEAQKTEIERDLMEDAYTDFCNVSLAFVWKDAYALHYNQLVKDGLLVMSEPDKERIQKETGGDVKQCKIKAVEEYFTKLKEGGATRVYQLPTT